MRGFLLSFSLLAIFTASEAYAQYGACCNPLDGTCVEYFDAATCGMLGRNYQGDGTECATANCPVPPPGACCSNIDGTCSEVGEDLCAAQSGTWQGEGVLCVNVTCPIPAEGACWDIYYGTCDIRTEAACPDNGQYVYQGDNTDCTTNPPPPIGACCRASDGRCVADTTEQFCENVWPYDWLGAGTVCTNDETNPCPQPLTGACCLPDGSCVDGLYDEDYCIWDYEGVWQGLDTDCTTVTCPLPVYGACCFPNGGCLVVLENDCNNNFGVFNGQDSECWPSPCTGDFVNGWEDNFDSYAYDTLLSDVGGWYGWDNNILYAGVVSDEQAHSAPHSLKGSELCDAVHPFERPFEDTKWILTIWQYLPSNLDATTFITIQSWYQHDNPDKRFAAEIQFNPANGGTVSEVLRANDSWNPIPNSLPLVYDQWVEIVIKADFEDDGFEMYYNGNLLIDASWTFGAVSTSAIMCVDLYAPQLAPVYYDDISIVADPGSTGPEFGPTRPLFAGLDSTDYTTRSTDMTGAPDVTWYSNGFKTNVDGAAGRPDGAVYISGEESFSTTSGELYLAPLGGPAIFVCETDESFSGLAYGKGKLYGYANYASPKGIYEIDTDTGACTLVADTSSMNGYFFGLDYNPADGLLYGTTEYGSPTGLYSINVDTGAINFVAAYPGAATRGIACGYDNKLYAMPVNATGVDPIIYMYDLNQGVGGTWQTAMSHPFPGSNNTGGLAWIPGHVPGDTNCDGKINGADISGFVMALLDLSNYETTYPDCIYYNADLNADGDLDTLDVEEFVDLVLN